MKLLHIAKQCFIVRRGNEARLSPYEAIMEIMKRRLRGMKRSLMASCFFAKGQKKWRTAFETGLPGLTAALTSDFSESGEGNFVYNTSFGKKF